MNIINRMETSCYMELMRLICQRLWTRYGNALNYYAIYLDEIGADLMAHLDIHWLVSYLYYFYDYLIQPVSMQNRQLYSSTICVLGRTFFRHDCVELSPHSWEAEHQKKPRAGPEFHDERLYTLEREGEKLW